MSGITNVNKTKSTLLNVNLNIQSETFKLVTVLCAVIFVGSVLFFSFLRLRFQIYAPRLLLIENKICTLANLPKSFFAWVSPAIRATDDDIFTFAGIDALVYVRFLKLVLKLALFTLPYGFIVLLPINVNGGNGLTDGLDKMSMSNVTKSSNALWAHFIAVWLYTLATLYLTYVEWQVYIKYRQRYLKRGSGNQFAVLVRDIPSNMTENQDLKRNLDELFPNKISSIYVISDLTKWQNLVKKHDALVIKYERAKFYAEKTGKVPEVSKHPCGTKVDAIEQYEKDLELIQEQIIDEKNRGDYIPLPCALVFFKSLKSSTSALQSVWTTDPLSFHVTAAPEPNEIMWNNLKIKFPLRKLRMVIGMIFIFFLVIFWTVPILFISSLTKIQALAKELGWLNDLKAGTSEMVLSLIQGVVPVALISLFYVILPYILFAVAQFQGYCCKSNMAIMVFQCLFIFQTFNTFFIYIISGSVLQNLSQIAQSPLQLPSLLAKSLPSQSGFFINYLALSSFVGLAVELTRIVPLILTTFKLKCLADTQRDRLEAWKPKRPEYEVMFSQGLLFFLIGISYSILSPIIIPFFVLYYAFGYVVWVYQLLHVYIAEWEHGGRFWPQVFYRILVAIFVFQLLMMGVFFLKKMWYAGVMIVPLIVLTVIYWWFISTQYTKQGDYLVLSEAVSSQYAERTFLDEVRKRYIRDSSIPDIYEYSTDNKYTSYDDYIPIIVNDSEGQHELTENESLLQR